MVAINRNYGIVSEACEQFFNELASKGGYSLQQAKGTVEEDYRLAYRAGYANLDSPEVLIIREN